MQLFTNLYDGIDYFLILIANDKWRLLNKTLLKQLYSSYFTILSLFVFTDRNCFTVNDRSYEAILEHHCTTDHNQFRQHFALHMCNVQTLTTQYQTKSFDKHSQQQQWNHNNATEWIPVHNGKKWNNDLGKLSFIRITKLIIHLFILFFFILNKSRSSKILLWFLSLCQIGKNFVFTILEFNVINLK